METSSDTSRAPRAEGEGLFLTDAHGDENFNLGVGAATDAAGTIVATSAAPKIRRLIADQRYFGLNARFFHAGAERMLERMAAVPAEKVQVDLETLGHDFLLEPADALGFLRALIAGGLLLPDGTGYYRPTPRFREYALAPLVAPLSRARARTLVDAVCDQVAQINADWVRNPFEVKMVAVSGAYMSRDRELPELSLWLVLRPRPQKESRRWRPMVTKGAGLRQILAAVSTLSSFIVVRIVAHKNVIPRPFCVVFQAAESFSDPGLSASQRVREWGASIGELLGASPYSGRRGRRSR